MIVFDKEHLSNTLEAIKLSQESLKQLMTLSAGGLVLYFSFIAKHSTESPNILGTLVVTLWALALICAAYSQYNLSTIYTSLSSHYDAHRAIQVVIETPIPSEGDPWSSEEIEVFQSEINEAKDRFRDSMRHFDHNFFPAQERHLRCMRASLVLLVSGFLVLVVEYASAQLSR